MQVKKVKVTLFDIKNAFEWFEASMTKETFPADFALLIYHNYNLLKTPYQQLVQGLYDERRDPRYAEYCEKMKALVMKYVDRDEQANPVFDQNKQPVINEMHVEFDKATAELDKEYSSLNTAIGNKTANNLKFLSQEVVVTLCVMDILAMPKGVPPHIVGLLVKPEAK